MLTSLSKPSGPVLGTAIFITVDIGGLFKDFLDFFMNVFPDSEIGRNSAVILMKTL
jgi:hypothetical protein